MSNIVHLFVVKQKTNQNKPFCIWVNIKDTQSEEVLMHALQQRFSQSKANYLVVLGGERCSLFTRA